MLMPPLNIGRIDLMVHLDLHDVLVLGHRPVRPEAAVLAVVDRLIATQPLEVVADRVVLEQLGIADVDFVERNGERTVARGVDLTLSMAAP
jgi:hypothetical protein